MVTVRTGGTTERRLQGQGGYCPVGVVGLVLHPIPREPVVPRVWSYTRSIPGPTTGDQLLLKIPPRLYLQRTGSPSTGVHAPRGGIGTGCRDSFVSLIVVARVRTLPGERRK